MIQLTVQAGGRVLEKKEFSGVRRLTIGRSSSNDVVLDNTGVSRVHCEILREGRVHTLCDSGSNNGTFVNGKRVAVHYLNSGDTISIGKFTIGFEEEPRPGPPPAPELARPAGAEGRPAEGKADGKSGAALSDSGQLDATLSIDARYMESRFREQERRAKGYLVEIDRKSEPIILDKVIFTAGKAAGSDIKLEGFFARARHAMIVRDETGFHLCDASGKSRSVVNGTRCDIELLHDGDEILVGGRKFRFMVGSPLSNKASREAAAVKPAREGTTRTGKRSPS